jgi:kinesin family protein 18/19
MAAAGASSISVTVRVRPFTIREAAQVTRRDDQTLFLGDGSLAGLPTPKVNSKGIRPVIKVMDEKCLYGQPLSSEVPGANMMSGFSTHRRTTQSSDSAAQQ